MVFRFMNSDLGKVSSTHALASTHAAGMSNRPSSPFTLTSLKIRSASGLVRMIVRWTVSWPDRSIGAAGSMPM